MPCSLGMHTLASSKSQAQTVSHHSSHEMNRQANPGAKKHENEILHTHAAITHAIIKRLFITQAAGHETI